MSVSRVVFTYVNGRQIFTVPPGYASNIRYHCWGGGGGAGGAAGGNFGGNGSAGGYTTGTFLANVGDEIEVCVGGGGQQGATVNSGRKIASAEIPGLNTGAAGNTGCFGWVPDTTGDQYYPRYGDQLLNRSWQTWSSFMNTYAVWPNNTFVGPVEENWDNQIWFPITGDYTFTWAADNLVNGFLDGTQIFSTGTNENTFRTNGASRTIRVTKGQHILRLQGFNTQVGGNNPVGVAVLVTGPTPSSLNNSSITPELSRNMVWNTRLGTSVDLTSSVPVWAAPLCTFYEPTTPDYGWGDFSAGRNFAFVSATSTWTAADLARLNFNFNNIYTISRPVRITGVGDIDHFITSGYYRFKRGESWDLARYNWLGDPFNNTKIPFDKPVPASWIPKQNMTYSQPNRQRNVIFAGWDLPVPGPDEIFVVGYVDGQARILPEGRGSSNLRWTVNFIDGNDYGGGDAGRAAINVGTGSLNFYGGWGGQQGGRAIAGGGGGGGGASTINILNPTTVTVTQPVVGLVSRWYQNLVMSNSNTGTWYNEINVPSGNLAVSQQSKETMPGTTKPSVFRTSAGAPQTTALTQLPWNLSGLVGGTPTSFTLEAWVYATGAGSDPNGYGGIIINKDFEYEVARFANGRIGIAVDWGQGAAASLPGSGWMFTDYFLPLNEAHLISVVFEGLDCRLFVDGNRVWSAAIDGFLSGGGSGTRIYTVYRNTPLNTNFNLWVGTRTSKTQNFQGYITDVRLWGVARSADQIKASVNEIDRPVTRVRQASNITAAAGGGGGGGAGSESDGQNAISVPEIASGNPLGRSAGGTGGVTAITGGGGGGGGGGGADGGRGGSGGSRGDGSGRGGDGGSAGKSGIMLNLGGLPTAEFAMVGKGGHGGAYGGGGGGGGDVITGSVKLRKTQRIEIGGAGDRGDEWEGTTVIRFTETEYIAAGPGGQGGENNSPWGSKGEGQPGGVPNDSRTPVWGGSGGGGGVELRQATASGGKSSAWSLLRKAPGLNLLSFANSGGSTGGSPSFSSGGGGGANTAGQGGESSGKAGNGGFGRDVIVGGRTYTLGAGGGGSAGRRRRGIQFVGLGGRGGGGDGESGDGNGLEYTVPGEYAFTVPRGVTTMYIEGVGAGGGGGSGAARGNGGGGSGGYLPRTAFTVFPGRRISFTVRSGGKSGENGGSTTIRIFGADGNLAQEVTLQGGRTGSSSPSATPRGGAGGTPNGNAGEDGGKELNDFFYSGRGADSPYGSGGKDASTNPKDDADSRRPGNADGYGAGGGGGYSGRPGGLGSGGFVRVEWDGIDTKTGLPNTGSGGGGGFEDFGGDGGSGFCVIAYAGAPVFNYVVNNRVVEPLQQNGYTIHECRQTGDLVYQDSGSTGEILVGNGTVPPRTNVQGYINAAGSGGFGRDAAVYPVSSALYPQFLNNYGVWEQDPDASNFDRDFEVFFPSSTEYILTCYADNGAQVRIDGGLVLDLSPASRDNGTYWWKNGLQTRKSISSGPHALSWQATNLSTAGAFALTIAPVSDPARLVFDSRRPPITGGSGNGNPGLVVLEFPVVEGASQIKVTDDNGVAVWRKITGTWVKVDNVWKVVQASWVKLDGAWRSLFGALGITSAIDTTNFGGPPKPTNKIVDDVTCISVIDETGNSLSAAAFNGQWSTFRSNYPNRPFWILVPTYPGLGVYVPDGYNEENLGFGPVEVARDMGSQSVASDWFTITSCDRLSPGSKVALAVDVSGSMNRSTVSASISQFVSKCRAAGLNLVLNADFGNENYIAPFNKNF